MTGVQRMLRYAGRLVRRRYRGAGTTTPGISSDYIVLREAPTQDIDGWQIESVAERQHRAFMPLLESARAGQPREDFVAAGRAVAATGLVEPLIVEVGCGSGYYSEILPLLLKRPVRYMGIDYSVSMTALARRTYPAVDFVAGDGCSLPLADNCCDILLSGTSLMHIADYEKAIAESTRVSGHWCIFHTVPVMETHSTVFLRKRAYGEPVVELIFNKTVIQDSFEAHGLSVRAVFESIPYDVSRVVGERTWTLTYLCQKT
jgi:SAM-dependent methyltransferase